MDTNSSEYKSIPELLTETRRLMRRYLTAQRMEAKEGLDAHSNRGRVILLLQKTGNLSQRELADILGIRKQSLGEVLQKLETEGLVVREPAENDKRCLIVSLTDKGKEARVQTLSLEEAFSCLTAPEQELFAEYLGRVRDRLRELTDGKDIPERPHHCGHGRPPFLPPLPPFPPGWYGRFPGGPESRGHHHGRHHHGCKPRW